MYSCQIGGEKIKSLNAGIMTLLIVVLLVFFTGLVYADHPVNQTPEVQGITTATSANVQGTVTETDSGAWTSRDNLYFDVYGSDNYLGYGNGPGALTDPLLGDQAIITT